jgi:crotonobetainyl-CoA:carnitine CoA-transferase CaiB-like acyl-CoA transferase
MDLFEHPDFKTAEARAKNRKTLNERAERGFDDEEERRVGRDPEQGRRALRPIYSMDEVFADPQVKHMQVAAEVPHKKLGKLRLINQPVKLSRTPAKLAHGDARSAASTRRGSAAKSVFSDDVEGFKSKGIV